jgi:hypothetical protein
VVKVAGWRAGEEMGRLLLGVFDQSRVKECDFASKFIFDHYWEQKLDSNWKGIIEIFNEWNMSCEQELGRQSTSGDRSSSFTQARVYQSITISCACNVWCP